jgi:cell division protein YceG involved in septum cleavage
MMKKLWKKYSYVIVLISITYISIFALIHKLDQTDEFMKITVQQGESLWEIAEKYSDRHSMSSPEFIDWVEQKNNINGKSIYPGDQLVIPVKENQEITVLAGE